MSFGSHPPRAADIPAMPLNAAVALWLAAGYAWEAEDFELIPDDTWHALCGRLADNFEFLAHPNKHHLLIDFDALIAGTVYFLKPEDFPPLARGLAQRLALAWHGQEIAYTTYPNGKWCAVCY
jgi:hypothetical protein